MSPVDPVGGNVDPFDVPELSDEEAALLAAVWEADGRRRHLEHTVTPAEAAAMLRVEPRHIEDDIKAGRLWATSRSGEQRVPRWEFVFTGQPDRRDAWQLLPHLTEVLGAMPVSLSRKYGEMMHAFMTTPQDETLVDGEPVSAVDWLADGRDPNPVIEALTDYDCRW
ncbi:helix-turn-helix domain-containing protein [Frondihabitans sp. Leaf304]|uniref:helix-turn-helix domain-containing protein n=1 Tax=Frondihabitans sp. Leaf304 TaxID=1736329 RepID=UPI0006F5C54F|nr:helix-turn-helix domain-containing protein [Frondihabitans sp. Leaf304]KQQ28656.1 hypothetical protein ASF54_08405 [Frondihabitans sp. Leaf304]